MSIKIESSNEFRSTLERDAGITQARQVEVNAVWDQNRKSIRSFWSSWYNKENLKGWTCLQKSELLKRPWN